MKDQIWWQKNKQYLIVASGITLTLLLVFFLAVFWFGWNWTGFNGGESKIIQAPQGTTAEYTPGKTLWDWLQLLIIPVVLAIAGFLLNQIQKERDQKAEDARRQREEIAAKERENLEHHSREDNQRETAVQEYIDKMSELLLKEHLHGPHPSDEARKIARIRTLTVLHRLDGERKRIVLQFLYEAGLIDKNNRIVELNGADFQEANLRWLHLENAHLGGSFCWKVDFSDAFLHGAYLGGVEFKDVTWNRADLSEAYLNAAIFLDADGNKDAPKTPIEERLKDAQSLKGAILPDGSIHL